MPLFARDLHAGYTVEVLVNGAPRFTMFVEHTGDSFDARQLSGNLKLVLFSGDIVTIQVTPLETISGGTGHTPSKKARYQALADGCVLNVERLRVY